MEGPRAPRDDEMPACLDLVNRVFRRDRPPTMADEFPLLFAAANRERLRVIVEAERVRCHVGVFYQAIRVGPSVVPVACVGAVCTDPAARGHGLASRALEDAMVMMRRDGRLLMLVSGNRGLYTRQECVTVGRRFTFRPRRSPEGLPALRSSPAAVSVRRRREEDVPRLAALYDAEAVRYERAPEMWRALLPAFEGHGSTVVVIEHESRGAVAYLVIRHGGPMAWDGPGVGRVLEYSGDREAVIAALAPAADLVGATELRMSVPADQATTAARLVETGLTPEEGPLPGTLRVLDAEGLLACLAPCIEEQGARVENRGPEKIERDGLKSRRVRQFARGLSAADFARFLFSGQAPEGPVPDALAGAVPIPLPEPGLNYI